MQNKQLEKALKDAIKEKKHVLGVKQVLSSIKNSKLVILSKSISHVHENEINESANKEKIPTFQFEGSSVALGRLCGLQFRVSAVSLTSINDSNIQTILKNAELKWDNHILILQILFVKV